MKMTKRNLKRLVCASWTLNVGQNKFLNALYADGCEVSWLVGGERTLETIEAELIADIKSRQVQLFRLQGLIDAKNVSTLCKPS